MQTLMMDVRCAFRALMRSRAYTTGVVTALALAIAATAVVFAVVHAVLLKPLPFADPKGLVWIWATRTDRDKAFFSIPDYLDYQRTTTTLETVAAYASWGVNLTGGSNPERLQGAKVTGSAFTVLGVSASVGRTLISSDGGPAANRVVVISDALWRRRFGADSAIVGSRVQLNGEDHEVAGVLPPSFMFPGLEAELYAPLAMERDARRSERGTNFLRVFGRLRACATVMQVRDEWGGIARELRKAYPESNAKKTEPRVLPLREEMLGAQRPSLMLLIAAVFGVWLLACVNILNLQLIRLLAREREGAIRGALGGTAMDLARPHLLESAALVCAGGALGAAVSAYALPLFVTAVPVALPRASEIRIDASVVTFTFGIIGATALLVAVLPLVRKIRQANLERVLRRTAGNAGTSHSHQWARNGLVVFEIAAALCLFLVTSFALNTYHRLQSLDPGVRLEGLVQTRISLPGARYPTLPALERFLMLAFEEVLRVPGVTQIAAANALPLSAQNIRTDFVIVGAPPASAAEVPGAQNRWVTSGYFETLGISVIDGRSFTDADATARAPVAVVDDALAARFWPGRSAVGSQVRILDGTPEGRVLTVVGVVRDVTHFEIGESPLGTLYGTVQQLPRPALGFFASSFMIAVSATDDSERTRRAIVEAIRRVDPDVPTAIPSTMADQLARVLASRRFLAAMLALFAAAALLLAVSGVYTVVSAAAREQTREFAIRLALGAPRAAMLTAVLGLAARLLAVGIPLGFLFTAVAALLAGEALNMSDWRLWTLAPVAMCSAAISASYIRARQVLALDPAMALRGD